MNKSELTNKLMQVDMVIGDLFPGTDHKCVIVGGSALLLLNSLDRVTKDIDAVEITAEISSVLVSYGFDLKVSGYIDCLPYNYEDRLVKIDVETKHIMFYTPSLEDLVVMKLYGSRTQDEEDLEHISKNNMLDYKLLEKAVEEAKLSAINSRRYEEMVEMYKRFIS